MATKVERGQQVRIAMLEAEVDRLTARVEELKLDVRTLADALDGGWSPDGMDGLPW